MATLISEDSNIVEKLALAFSNSTKDLLDLDCNVLAREFLSRDRVVEQLELLKKMINSYEKYDFKNKKLLEVGTGVGSLLIVARKDYGLDAYGIEPSDNEFSPFREISSKLLAYDNLPQDIITNGFAENLPFESNSFDLIYSSNVLEHVKDPKKVLEESIRVLKPGGYLQFVIPNYFSFWEGHYAAFWPCITNKTIAKIYASIIGKNPKYIDTLQLINPFYLKDILKSLSSEIQVLDWGKDVFKNRLSSGNYSDWASLRKIRPIVQLVQNLKLAKFIAGILNSLEMYTPIVVTLRKR